MNTILIGIWPNVSFFGGFFLNQSMHGLFSEKFDITTFFFLQFSLLSCFTLQTLIKIKIDIAISHMQRGNFYKEIGICGP